MMKADIALLENNRNHINNNEDFIGANNGIIIRKNFILKIPWFLLLLDLIQITLFIMDDALKFGKSFLFMPHKTGQIWRFISYMLLHSDAYHLVMNICLQTLIGFWLENEQGHIKVAIIYFIGVISGSLATFIFQPQYSLMGASAGVYALLTSHIPHLWKNFELLSKRYMRIVALCILISSDISFTVLHFFFNNNTGPRISIVAHTSGALGGFVGGFLIYKTLHSYCPHIKYHNNQFI